jgi:hypothetical protein
MKLQCQKDILWQHVPLVGTLPSTQLRTHSLYIQLSKAMESASSSTQDSATRLILPRDRRSAAQLLRNRHARWRAVDHTTDNTRGYLEHSTINLILFRFRLIVGWKVQVRWHNSHNHRKHFRRDKVACKVVFISCPHCTCQRGYLYGSGLRILHKMTIMPST